MANMVVWDGKMDDLWGDEKFQDFFSETKMWGDILHDMDEYGECQVNMSSEDFLKALRRVVPEEQIEQAFNSRFLEDPKKRLGIEARLFQDRKDCVQTACRHAVDSRMEIALRLMYPEKELQCHSFSESGDYSRYSCRGSMCYDIEEGNVFDDELNAEFAEEHRKLADAPEETTDYEQEDQYDGSFN